jgi:hypothetical protein
MAFDAELWRKERLRLLERLHKNVDTARWLHAQAVRAVHQATQLMQAIDSARSERTLSALGEPGEKTKSPRA